MFFGLDSTLMTYVFGAAMSAMAVAGYYMTRKGAPSLGLAQADLQAVAKGIIKGTLHDDDLNNILQCVADPKQVVDDFEFAIANFSKKDMEMTDVMASLTKIGMSVKKLAEAAKECDNEMTKRELEILQKMVGKFADPKTFAYEMGANIVVNGVDIYREMSAAYTSYLAKDYESFGRDIGVSLALIFIGASDAAKANPGAAKVMESMASMELHPSLTDDMYKSADNTKWLEYLAQIAAEDEPVPNYNIMLANMAYNPQPVLAVDVNQYVQLLNLMSKQNQNGYLY